MASHASTATASEYVLLSSQDLVLVLTTITMLMLAHINGSHPVRVLKIPFVSRLTNVIILVRYSQRRYPAASNIFSNMKHE